MVRFSLRRSNAMRLRLCAAAIVATSGPASAEIATRPAARASADGTVSILRATDAGNAPSSQTPREETRKTEAVPAPLDGVHDDGPSFSSARRIVAPNGTITVAPGTFHPVSPVVGGPAGPILWRFDGNCYDAACKAPVIGLGGDTVENYFQGTKYFGRLHSTPDTGPVLRVGGQLTHQQKGGPVPVLEVDGTLGDPDSPGGTYSAFPWVSLHKLDIFGPGGQGQSVASYSQVNRFSGGAGMFGTVTEVVDMTGGASGFGGGHVVEESDLTANGPDSGQCTKDGCRIMHDDVIATAGVVGIVSATILSAGSGAKDGTYPMIARGGLSPDGRARAAKSRSATGRCIISRGAVTDITIADQGAGYVAPPPLVCEAKGLQGFRATGRLGSMPPSVGTIYRIGGRDGTQSIGAYIRLVNRTPVTDAMIDTTGGVLADKSAVLRLSPCQNLADFSGDGGHLLSFCGNALSYREQGREIFAIDDAGGMRPPAHKDDPTPDHSKIGAIYFNTTANALKRFDGRSWVWVEPQRGTPDRHAACEKGQRMYDDEFEYICVRSDGSGGWRKIALAPL